MTSITEQLVVRVARIDEEAERIRSFELVRPDGQDLPPFTAGAHVSVALPGGLVREYSLCNDPAERHRYVIGVLCKSDGRGGSIAMHERVQAGDTLSISAPVNHFALRDEARRSILIAGGIGITPILAMAHELTRRNAEFQLCYLSRSQPEAAFCDLLMKPPFERHVACHYDSGRADRQFDIAGLLKDVQPGTHIYCCGPAGLTAAVQKATAHWPSDQVHFEFFTNADAGPMAGDGAFEVVLAKSGRRFTVAPGETILQVLLREGIDVPYSCEEGSCGTCLTAVLEGAPEHRDVVLDKAERESNRLIAICCSRAKGGSLTLDL